MSSPWEPASIVSREEVLKLHHEVAARPSLPTRIYEDVFRIQALEMDWDIGVTIYEPQDLATIPTGSDGKKVGIFLLHGGVSDYKSVERVAQTMADKFGIKVASMTFPGRFYLLDSSRDWPGDVENPDGTARTPLWTKETQITRDQYEIVQDTSKRESYGTLISLSAKKGTEFYYCMAAWPVAFEAAMKETARRHLPGRPVLDLYSRPFHRWAVRYDGGATHPQHLRDYRLRYVAVRLHVYGSNG